MYGTIAKMRVKPGHTDAIMQAMKDEPTDIRGYIGFQLYRSDEDANVFWMSVQFQDKESYQANADDPRQDELYQKLVEHLEAPPEWHDGEIVFAQEAAKV